MLFVPSPLLPPPPSVSPKTKNSQRLSYSLRSLMLSLVRCILQNFLGLCFIIWPTLIIIPQSIFSLRPPSLSVNGSFITLFLHSRVSPRHPLFSFNLSSIFWKGEEATNLLRNQIHRYREMDYCIHLEISSSLPLTSLTNTPS